MNSDHGKMEVESKLALSDLPAVKAKLRELGAGFEGSFRIIDTYYTSATIARMKRIVRVRRVGAQVGWGELTFKGEAIPRGIATQREELTSRVSDPNVLETILQRVGMQYLATVTKQREEYRLADVPVYLDNVDNLGLFVEIGAPVLPEEAEKMQERIAEIVRQLDLNNALIVSRSYLALALAVKKTDRK